MADFRNMLGSDEDSNEDMDHIPKTPGPPLISSDRESDEEKSDDEKEEEVKNDNKESDSDSDSSSSQVSDSSNDNNQNARNDSEVERSDNENEDNEENQEMDENIKAVKTSDAIKANDGMSSDENEDNGDKVIEQSRDKEEEEDSDEEDVVRRVSLKKKRQLENSDSSDDEESNRNKKHRTESIDNEDNEEKDQNENKDENEDKDEETADKSAKATDIFGEMSSEDEEEEDRPKDKPKDDENDSDKESVNRDNERRDDESDDEDRVRRVGDSDQPFIEDEPIEEPITETRIDVEIPRIVADLGSEVHFVKLPNFLSIDTHPYDPQWYEDEIDEDENLDDEGRARLKLKVENTIRWRNVVEGENHELKKESNTRIVRWSDGTFSLHLGEEIFDIHKLPLMTGDNNHLFIRQGTGLQGQTVFRSKLNFRPFSTESFTHRKLTLSLADRSQKTQKIRVLPNVGKDPEAHRTEMIKKEEDRLKASIRRENKQRRVRERSLIRGPTASYLEPDGDEDDEEEGISLSRIKNQYKRGSFSKSYDDPELSAEESKQANDDDSEDDLFDKKTEKKRSAHIVESDDE